MLQEFHRAMINEEAFWLAPPIPGSGEASEVI